MGASLCSLVQKKRDQNKIKGPLSGASHNGLDKLSESDFRDANAFRYNHKEIVEVDSSCEKVISFYNF